MKTPTLGVIVDIDCYNTFLNMSCHLSKNDK